MRVNCISCEKINLEKDTVGINKKLLGDGIDKFYCMECLAGYLDVSVNDLLEKIEEFKDEGCMFFE